ncbi:cyclin-D4-1-like [Gastrolobium bilobum]|uniref:cyclin-D4-1-like n=1 Tax=Gastrolobium bilobum TaxID=150636 RepID=UPI002AAF3ED1|nr:cyclin-D4-1-like [Gastrolobium bilobum]
MEESIDPATSSLLCLENENICFDDLECSAADGSPYWDHKNVNFNNQCLSNDNLGSEPMVGFLVPSDETVELLVEREREHLPRDDYLKRLRNGDLNLSVRRDAVDWIWKAHEYFGFGPCSFFLAVNYLDRFISVYELQKKDIGWSMQLLAVACLLIAAKVEEWKVPKAVDFQEAVGEPNFVFEAKTIKRMELHVLNTLGWKMQALTPFSFLDYFLSKITCEQHPAKSFILRSVELVLNIIRCIDFLEFRPSEIAAAVAISVSRELQAGETDKALNCLAIVKKERILKCLELIRDLNLIKVSGNLQSTLARFVPQSPVGVLDAACLSSRSDEVMVGSCTNSSHNSRNIKKIKSDGASDGTFKP